jgi:hypothetical protein
VHDVIFNYFFHLYAMLSMGNVLPFVGLCGYADFFLVCGYAGLCVVMLVGTCSFFFFFFIGG